MSEENKSISFSNLQILNLRDAIQFIFDQKFSVKTSRRLLKLTKFVDESFLAFSNKRDAEIKRIGTVDSTDSNKYTVPESKKDDYNKFLQSLFGEVLKAPAGFTFFDAAEFESITTISPLHLSFLDSICA